MREAGCRVGKPAQIVGMNPICLRLLALPALLLIGQVANLNAENWPHFRGPAYNGISATKKWNPKFSEPKVSWEAKVGTGAASFVVSGNKVITSGNVKDNDVIWCFDLDSGKEIWKTSIPCKFEKRMFEGGTAATATIDGDHVYNLSYDGQLYCLKLKDGSEVWKKHLIDDFGGKLSRWKYSGAPLIQGNMVVVDCGGKNSTLALNKKTGKKIWGKGSGNAGYASPVPIKVGGKSAVAVFKGKAMVAHELKSGRVLWDVPWETSYDVNASSPVPVGSKQMVVTSGYGGGRAALYDISGSKPKQVWRNDDIKTKMSSAVVIGEFVYAVCGDNGGKLVCVGLKDGKTKWTEKGFGFGSLAATADKLIVLGEKGNLVIAQADGSAYKPISEATILPKKCWVNPVIAHGRLLCKNNKGKMVCLDLR